jgi:8-oxo-dGTP pyrophosphatase MutT (NUDIX family)
MAPQAYTICRMTIEKRSTFFRGRVITVTVDEVILPNGHREQLELVHHPGGAAAVAIDAEECVCLLRQYRHAANGWLWELPAGKLEPDEPPLATAKRELIEEAGVSARDWRSLGACFSSPGVFSEVLHLFLARELQKGVARPEASEVFEVHWTPLAQALEWAVDGTIQDSKTALGLLRAYHLRAKD